jgi:2-polyprenyl-6-methoxyphenol hydroxylase-like FAD-dependent oxidoreductase
VENKELTWTVCLDCQGSGKRNGKITKNERYRYQLERDAFEKSNQQGSAPVPPKGQLVTCSFCDGSGLRSSDSNPPADPTKFPHIAIIGGGIGGVALAVACLHRGIPFTLFERDASFADRSQGYGLTLQQASKAIEGFGLFKLEKGLVSKWHVVHNPEGKVVGEWGAKKWLNPNEQAYSKKTNVHIARQSLRLELLEQLHDHPSVQWGHQLIDFKELPNKCFELLFEVDGVMKQITADMVVGADGIRSVVRKQLIGEELTPMRYLGCIVILGICSLEALKHLNDPLLNAETVFQTANGHERIYVMPFSKEEVMWQLSFPIIEAEAKALSEKGVKALKEEAIRRTPWHSPIPEMLNATPESLISGYPAYDREILTSEHFSNAGAATLIGDAAHPMSPFKGQGANQALLDALVLARMVYKECLTSEKWKEEGLRTTVLASFESSMLERSATKVRDSAAAAEFLHTDVVLLEGNETRGGRFKRTLS